MQQLTPRIYSIRSSQECKLGGLKLTRRAAIFNASSIVESSGNDDDEAAEFLLGASANIPEISSRKSANGLSSSTLLLTSIENKHEAAADFTAASCSWLREN